MVVCEHRFKGLHVKKLKTNEYFDLDACRLVD